jgi:hypothetical protein
VKKIFSTSIVLARKVRHVQYRKHIKRTNNGLILAIIFIAIFSYLTNPFTKYSVIKAPFSLTYLPNGQIDIARVQTIYLIDNFVLNKLGLLKSTWHILSNSLMGGGPASKKETLDGIIDDIHALRFDPKEPYIISGDHFSVMYPRSLGIFYHTLLDPRTARSKEDWQRRQKIYLQTTLYVLEAYRNSSRLSTTITPIGPQSVTLNNFFDSPSDTMYSILYALRALETADDVLTFYSFPLDKPLYPLFTTEISKKLRFTYKDVIKRHLTQYLSDTVDSKTGLVRKDKSFSGKKDSVIRSSSFYDNVILWKTIDLAKELGMLSDVPDYFQSLKENILSTFWLTEEGYFLEDLSAESIRNKHYSSDWLIAIMTGFLSPEKEKEREYLIKSVEYIRKQQLNKPFALKYQPAFQKSKLHLPLQLFAPSYGTQAIWSHWGMEYIKLLNMLYQQTCEEQYLTEAKEQIDAYTNNILSSRGYPEVYSPDGKVFNTVFYKSVRKTGWVVNYEQAKLMTEKTLENAHLCYSQKYKPLPSAVSSNPTL